MDVIMDQLTNKALARFWRNPACVNPDHLFLGSQKDNIQDAARKGRLFKPHKNKTHCINGHPFNEENTRYVLDNGYRCRDCKTCRAASKRRFLERKRARAAEALKDICEL